MSPKIIATTADVCSHKGSLFQFVAEGAGSAAVKVQRQIQGDKGDNTNKAYVSSRGGAADEPLRRMVRFPGRSEDQLLCAGGNRCDLKNIDEMQGFQMKAAGCFTFWPRVFQLSGGGFQNPTVFQKSRQGVSLCIKNVKACHITRLPLIQSCRGFFFEKSSSYRNFFCFLDDIC